MVKAFQSGVRSWKTTTVAIITAIMAVGNVVVAIIDGDPATVPNWELTIGVIMTAIGLIFAKDSDK